MHERATLIKSEAAKAVKLSREAVEAMKAGNFKLSRTLIREAVGIGKKCQILIKEKENKIP